MFAIPKNAMVYRFNREINLEPSNFTECLSQFAYTPCKELERSKFGWVPPLGHETEELVHSSPDWSFISAYKETKELPAAVINKALNEKVKERETAEGRPLKKSEKDAIKDALFTELLPRAFSKYLTINVFINLKAGFIVVDSSSFNKAEDVLALLRKSLGSLPVIPAIPQSDIGSTMTEWVKEWELPSGFNVEHEVDLVSVVKDGGDAKFKNQDLDAAEIKACLDANKVVSKLRMNWQNRLSFSLSDKGAITRLKFSDEIECQNGDIPHEDVIQRLDADICLIEGEFDAFLSDLYSVLGGFEKQDLPETKTAEFESEESLLSEAILYIRETRRASVSGMQRKFKIGYNRAARMMEMLEQMGAVSRPGQDGGREVLLPTIDQIDQTVSKAANEIMSIIESDLESN